VIVFADTPTLGLLACLPLALLVALGCFLYGGWVIQRRLSQRVIDGWGLMWIAGGLVVLVATGIAMWPWKHDYHYWIPKEGKAQKISKRIVSNGDNGISERYVITIGGYPYGIDDTRASLVKPGDNVRIACKREYQWGSRSHGWGCRWDG
jgi:hypothetical protein